MDKSFEEIADTLIEGIISAYKECPDAENKTFEEIAEWAGQHVLSKEDAEEFVSQNEKPYVFDPDNFSYDHLKSKREREFSRMGYI